MIFLFGLRFHPIKSKGLGFERSELWDPVWILSSLEEEMYESNDFIRIDNFLIASALSFLDITTTLGSTLVRKSFVKKKSCIKANPAQL